MNYNNFKDHYHFQARIQEEKLIFLQIMAIY